jgi:hypothetical protein
MATVAAHLKNTELGRLFRALAAHMAGEDAGQYLTNSGLRLAFALLSPAIDESLERKATASALGSRGGRPRKHPKVEKQAVASPVQPVQEIQPAQGVSTKKSKKEDLSPTPPKEEKIKKNNIISPSPGAGAREDMSVVTVPSLEELQEQMLKEQPWFDELCMSRRISRQDMAMYVMDFIKYLREQDARETLPRAKAHFVNQLPYIIKIYKTNNNHENSQKFIADPVARREFERESRRQEVCRTLAELAVQSQHPVEPPF